MKLLRSCLTAAAASGCLCTASAARAGAYAYAHVVFTNTTLDGLTAGGLVVTGADEATGSNASFPGFAPAAFSAGPKDASAPLAQGSDVPQSYSGPSPAPAEGTYSQVLLDGFGVRGDARIGPSFAPGVGTRTGDVAEGRLEAEGSATSAAGTLTEFRIGVAPGRIVAVTLTVDASVSLSATTAVAGEFARAQVNASLTVAGTGGTDFTPFVFSPEALNRSVASADGGPGGTFSVGPTSFSTSVTLASGAYVLSLASGAQTRLSAGTAAPVPEPASLPVLGGGLLVLGLARQRKRA